MLDLSLETIVRYRHGIFSSQACKKLVKFDKIHGIRDEKGITSPKQAHRL